MSGPLLEADSPGPIRGGVLDDVRDKGLLLLLWHVSPAQPSPTLPHQTQTYDCILCASFRRESIIFIISLRPTAASMSLSPRLILMGWSDV